MVTDAAGSATTASTHRAAIACVAEVTRTLCELIDEADRWKEQIADLHGRRTPTAREIDDIVERLVVPGLSANDATMIGAGFVAKPGYLADAHSHLAWCLGMRTPSDSMLRRALG